jgi:hypothetical protein
VANGSDAQRRLADCGMVIIGGEWAPVRDAVPKLRRFPPRPLVECPGWSGEHFALADGRVFSPTGSDGPIVLFATDKLKCLKAGSPTGWKGGICRPLAGQQLCVFMMCAVFAAPLLNFTDRSDNFGFEIVGEPGVGKSTLQQLMATVAGGASPSSPGHYWVDCQTTANALEPTMMAHSDQPLIMEEAALYAAGESNASRGSNMNELAFKLARGSSKARLGGGQQTEHRLVYILSSNRSLAEVLAGRHRAEATAASDRLITLRLSEDRQFGIFDYIPAEYPSASAFAEALKATAAEHYGHAFPRFIRLLVARRSRDEGQLRRWIRSRLEEFRRAVAADLDDGSALRVVDSFGLCYVAGRLAQRFKILPVSFDCLRAAVTCYNLHREEARPLLQLPRRLSWLAQLDGVVDLDSGRPRLTDSQLHAVTAFLRTTRQGRREILFTQTSRDRFFPDFEALKRDPENTQWFKSEKGRDTARRFIREGGKKDPVYRFYLPPGPSIHDDGDDLD